MPDAWSRDEVELIVADYFAMLEAELCGRANSKAQHNRALRSRIGRSKGSIEFKHQNISAVLVNYRQPFIAGYLPRQNYQQLLEQVVLEWLANEPRFFQRLADGPVLAPPSRPDFPANTPLTSLIEAPPEGVVDADVLGDLDHRADGEPRFHRTDFVRRDAENRRLGRLGEEFVFEFEQRRLHETERRPDLARRVEWVADTRGDGAGYDIASFDSDESPRLIEVKTTGLGKHFPFLVTAKEVRVSERESATYHLYRVFEFSQRPRMYFLRGSLSELCHLEPTSYRANPR